MAHVFPGMMSRRQPSRPVVPEPEEPSREVNTRAWLLCCLLPFCTYIAADVLCILYIPLPSFGGAGKATDYWGLFGWILHFFGLLVYICTSLILFIRHSPFSSAVLLGYLFALTIMTVAAAAFAQNRVASEMLTVGYDAPTTAIQLQWVANVVCYVWFTAMVYHSPHAATHEHDPDAPPPATIKIEQLMAGTAAAGGHHRGLSLGGFGVTNSPGALPGLGVSGSMASATVTASPGGSGASSDDIHAQQLQHQQPLMMGGGGGIHSVRNTAGLSSMRRATVGAGLAGPNGMAGIGVSPLQPPRTGSSRNGQHKRTPSTGGNSSSSGNNMGGLGGTASFRARSSMRGDPTRRKTQGALPPPGLDPIASARGYVHDGDAFGDNSGGGGASGGVDDRRSSREQVQLPSMAHAMALNDGSMMVGPDDPPLGALA